MALIAVAIGHWTPAYNGHDLTGSGAACALVHADNYVGQIGTIKENFEWRVDRQKHLLEWLIYRFREMGCVIPLRSGAASYRKGCKTNAD